MRVVGYVRDAVGPSEGEPAFAQSERIRRWVNETGHQMVAVCQDVRTPGRPLGREGFRALLGIVINGEAEAVVVPDLTIFSADKVTQEIMIWDLRSRGVAVLSTSEEDQPVLSDPPAEQIRLIVRDVLAKVMTHQELHHRPSEPQPLEVAATSDDDSDVIVELIQPNPRLDSSGDAVRPAQ